MASTSAAEVTMNHAPTWTALFRAHQNHKFAALREGILLPNFHTKTPELGLFKEDYIWSSSEARSFLKERVLPDPSKSIFTRNRVGKYRVTYFYDISHRTALDPFPSVEVQLAPLFDREDVVVLRLARMKAAMIATHLLEYEVVSWSPLRIRLEPLDAGLWGRLCTATYFDTDDDPVLGTTGSARQGEGGQASRSNALVFEAATMF
ncbi:hypothetical protein AC579_9030 [Pseudocercospora musae]|uniref:Uncharacterized protein n=1 Tax=Pseudocercospora musae TaxID=113226 RepID=A0A139ISM2_9PEZI|nr:hypothetical protein AC579_9030 [Pseudocercospora musae]